MSREIDERVVSMKFDNRQFERNAATTISTLDKLKEKLRFDGFSKGIDEVGKAANRLDLSHMERGADAVGVKFDAMSMVAMSAINRLVNHAMSAGERMVKSLTIDPVTTGWSKYAQKTSAVQTIMAATAKEFDNTEEQMETVNEQLGKLAWFTDETSYNFTDMVSNIGKFTSNNVPLEKTVTAMQGIANWAAISGANATEASRAMYNLSQALGVGAVTAIDWKSIENANMATAEFKEMVLETAAAEGQLKKVGDGLYRTMKGTEVSVATFRESLSEKWFSSDVLINALDKYGTAVNTLYELSDTTGLTATRLLEAVDDYGNGTLDLGKFAREAGVGVEYLESALESLNTEEAQFSIKTFKAAQEAKTFAEAIDSAKEAVGSKWSQTFEIIFGDYLEAKELWTGLANLLYDIFASPLDNMNDMLKGWKTLGGQKDILKALSNAWENLTKVTGAFKAALNDIFPPMLSYQLKKLTWDIKEFSERLIISDEAANTLRVAFKALLLPVKVVVGALQVGAAAAGALGTVAFKLADGLLAAGSGANTLEGPLKKVFGEERYVKLCTAFATAGEHLGDVFGYIWEKVTGLFSALKSFRDGKTLGETNKLYSVLLMIGGWVLDRIVQGAEKLASIDWVAMLQGAGAAVEALTGKVTSLTSSINGVFHSVTGRFNTNGIAAFQQTLSETSQTATDLKTSLSFTTLMKSITPSVSGLQAVFDNLNKSIEKMTVTIDPARVMVFAFGTGLTMVLFTLNGTLAALKGTFTNVTAVFGEMKKVIAGFKPTPYQKMAGAIIALAGALVIMSLVDADRLRQATVSMLELMAALTIMTGAMAAINKFLVGSELLSGNFATISKSMILIAGGVLAMSIALATLSKVNLEGMGWKLLALAAVIVEMSLAMAFLSKFVPQMTANASGMLFFALAIATVVASLNKLTNLDLDAIKNAAAPLAVIMGVLTAMSVISGKMTFGGSLGVTLMVANILLVMKMLTKLRDVNLGELIGSLKQALILMGVLALVAKAMSKVGQYAWSAGVGILAMGTAILLLVEAIKNLKELKRDEIIRGGIVVGGALILFAAIMGLSKFAGAEAKKVGAAIIGMSIAINLLGIAIGTIGRLPADEAKRGAIVVIALLGLFGVITAASSAVQKAGTTIMAMTFAIGMLAAAITLFTVLPQKELLTSALALSMGMVAFGAAVKLVTAINWGKAFAAIAMMVVVAGGLTYLIGRIEQIRDVNGLLIKAAALSGLLLTIALSTMVVRQIKMDDWKAVVTTLSVMTVFIAEAVGVLILLDKSTNTDPGSLIAKAGALSGVLMAVAWATRVLKLVDTTGRKQVENTLAIMSTFLVESLFMLVALDVATTTDPWTLIGKAIALGTVLMAVAAATRVLDVVRTQSEKYVKYTLGMMSAFLVEGTLIMIALDKAVTGDPWTLIGKAAAFGEIMLAIGGSALLVSKIGKVKIDPASISSVMLGVLEVLGIAAIVIGALGALTKIPGIDQIADDVVKLSADLGAAIGGFVGSFAGALVGGIGVGFTAMLIICAENLSKAAEKIQGFVEACDAAANSQVAEGARNLSEAVAHVSSATIKSGKVKDFGDALKNLASPLRSFYEEMTLAHFVPDKIEAAAAGMSAIADMINAIPTEGGAFKWFTGEKSLDAFGEQLCLFGIRFKDYADNVKDINKDGVIDGSVAAAKSLAAFAKEIPAQGVSVATAFFGEHDMGVFGEQLKLFGAAFKSYGWFVQDLDGDQIQNVTTGAAGAIAKLATSIPSTSDSLLGCLFGNQDLGKFGTQLSSFGGAIKSYYERIKDIPDNVVEKSETVAKAMEHIIGMESSLSKIGGIIDIFKSSGDVGGFGEMLASLTDGFGPMLEAISALPDTIRGLNVAEEFHKIGVEMGTGLSTGFLSTQTTVEESARNAANAVYNSMSEELEISGYSKRFETIGLHIMTGLAVGMDRNQNIATEGIARVGQNLVTTLMQVLGIHSPSTVMRDEVGVWIVRGVAEGITKDTSAEEAASKKAQAIVSAFQKSLSTPKLDQQIADLELQSWKNLHPDATEEETKKQEEDTLTKKLRSQAKALTAASAQYKAVLTQVDADSEDAKNAYLVYLQERNAMEDLATKMSELRKPMQQAIEYEVDPVIAYAEYLASSKDQLLALGFSMEEIEAAAREKTGFGKETIANAEEAVTDVQAIINEFMEGTNDAVDVTVEMAVQKAASGGGSAGSAAASSFGDALNTDLAKMMDPAENPFTKIATGVKDALNSEETSQGFMGWIDGLLDKGNSSVSKWAEMGINWVKGLAGGLERKDAEAPAIKMMEGTINAAKNAAEIQSPSKKTEELGIYLVEGLAKGLRDSTALNEPKQAAADLVNAVLNIFDGRKLEWQTVGKEINEGIAKGLKENMSIVKEAAETVAIEGYYAALKKLQINSPSRLFQKVGMYSDLGFAKGLTDYAYTVTEASEKVGEGSVVAMQNVAAQMAEAFDADFDPEPTITPVLNLDNIQNGLDEVFSAGRTINLSGTVRRAQRAVRPAEANDISKTPGGSETTNNYFTQNNYSPKALSRLDIYRQTRNQFAAAKGRVTTR